MVTSKSEIFLIFDELKDTLRSMGVRRIGLFGSFAREESTSRSDVDVIVSFLPGCKNYDIFFSLAELLEDKFGRDVEIITEESISPYVRQEIEKDAGYYEVAA
jgi:uncharacterized protein